MTPLELIWNGWRIAYIEGSAEGQPTSTADGSGGSLFTQILRSGLTDEELYIVRRGVSTLALMNAFPYTSGHVLVLPYREVATLEELTSDEHAELWAMVTDAVRAVKAAYRPGGVNVGFNLGRAAGGSINEHVHAHVLPRWAGDGNFMTSVANARTLPQPLADSAARLREAWPVA